jgi:hypothetical protein
VEVEEIGITYLLQQELQIQVVEEVELVHSHLQAIHLDDQEVLGWLLFGIKLHIYT